MTDFLRDVVLQLQDAGGEGLGGEGEVEGGVAEGFEGDGEGRGGGGAAGGGSGMGGAFHEVGEAGEGVLLFSLDPDGKEGE